MRVPGTFPRAAGINHDGPSSFAARFPGPGGVTVPPALLGFVLPMAVSIGVPLAFLYAVRRLDLYGSGGFGLVISCFAFGLLAFPLSFVINTAGLRLSQAALGLSLAAALLLVKTLVAPVVEEIAKSLGLVRAVRRPDFTYFVDGAIYGFAAGTAFAIIENLFYLLQSQASDPLGMSINRAFSTSLMHGSASALVGVALGRFRYGRGQARALALALGWAAAILVHMAFNRVVNRSPLLPTDLVIAFAIGLGGVALTAAFIYAGLREERRWLREALDLRVGVSAGESAMVQSLSDLKTLLAPVEAHFGAAKRKDVEAFLRLQAQLGLKTKAASMSPDPAQRGLLLDQAADLQARMDVLRRRVGVYAMAYVRSILPPEGEPIWGRLDLAIAEAPAPQMNLWQTLGTRAEAAAAGAPGAPAASPTPSGTGSAAGSPPSGAS